MRDRIQALHQQGYRVLDNGHLQYPDGTTKPQMWVRDVPARRLLAYQVHGDAIFQAHVRVRLLDDSKPWYVPGNLVLLRVSTQLRDVFSEERRVRGNPLSASSKKVVALYDRGYRVLSGSTVRRPDGSVWTYTSPNSYIHEASIKRLHGYQKFGVAALTYPNTIQATEDGDVVMSRRGQYVGVRKYKRKPPLTLAVAAEIRHLYFQEYWGTKALAKKFNVSQAAISHMINNQTHTGALPRNSVYTFCLTGDSGTHHARRIKSAPGTALCGAAVVVDVSTRYKNCDSTQICLVCDRKRQVPNPEKKLEYNRSRRKRLRILKKSLDQQA